jgi:hypothetical protein
VEDARRVQVQDPTTLEPTAMKARMMAPVCDGLRRVILAAEVVWDEEQQRVAEPLRNNQSRSAGRHGGGNRRHLVCPALIRTQSEAGRPILLELLVKPDGMCSRFHRDPDIAYDSWPILALQYRAL